MGFKLCKSCSINNHFFVVLLELLSVLGEWATRGCIIQSSIKQYNVEHFISFSLVFHTVYTVLMQFALCFQVLSWITMVYSPSSQWGRIRLPWFGGPINFHSTCLDNLVPLCRLCLPETLWWWIERFSARRGLVGKMRAPWPESYSNRCVEKRENSVWDCTIERDFWSILLKWVWDLRGRGMRWFLFYCPHYEWHGRPGWHWVHLALIFLLLAWCLNLV